MWSLVPAAPSDLQEALRFWLLSYNSSHSTLMTRIVAKAGQADLVVTSGQPGVLYISGLPVEKNVFSGVARKLKTVTAAFSELHGGQANVVVHCGSSRAMVESSGVADYIFTDPPFGGNIPYAEVNYLNEAWLGSISNRAEEAIVSRSQDKSIGDYQNMLADVFRECARVLAPTGKSTVVFHSASADVWNALQTAYGRAGFFVERASVLDKAQSSFKQVTTRGAVKGDPALLLTKEPLERSADALAWKRVAAMLQTDAAKDHCATENSPQRLYSRLVSHFLSRHQPVPVDAAAFYHWLADRARGLQTATTP
jgi:hypothetical protein